MKTRGFTLIELIIVIAIIGTMAGLIIPRFSGGTRPIGARDFGAVVNEIKCSNGLLMKNGDPVIENGNAVKC